MKVEVPNIYLDIIQNLKKNPPITKVKGLKLLTSDGNIFKGKELVDWLTEYLGSAKKENADIVGSSPAHAFLLASTLLDNGAIRSKSQSVSRSSSRSQLDLTDISSFSGSFSQDSLSNNNCNGNISVKKEPFSLRNKYVLDCDNISVCSGSALNLQLPSCADGGGVEDLIFGDSKVDDDEADDRTEIKKRPKSLGSLGSLGSLSSFTSLKIKSPNLRRASLPSKSALAFLKQKTFNVFDNESDGGSVTDIILFDCVPPPGALSSINEDIQKFSEFCTQSSKEKVLKVGDKCSDFQLPDQKGKLKSLGSFLKRGPVLLNFLIGGDGPVRCSDLNYLSEVDDYLNCKVLNISPENRESLTKTAKRLDPTMMYLSDIGMNVTRDFGCYIVFDEIPPNLLGFMSMVVAGSADSYGYENHLNPPYFPVKTTFIIDIDFTVKFSFTDCMNRADQADIISVLKDLKTSKDERKKSKRSLSTTSSLTSNLRRRLSGGNVALFKNQISPKPSLEDARKDQNECHQNNHDFNMNNMIILVLVSVNVILAWIYFVFM